MNKYLILGPNFEGRLISDPKYRGIDRRDIPEIPNDNSKSKQVNQAIKKYMEIRDFSTLEGEYLRNYNIASEIANLFTLNNEKGEIYEVIQVVYIGEEQPKNKQFLGYDVISTNEYGSIIINFFNKKNMKIESEFEKFKELLNDNFLFANLNLAKEFCDLAFIKLGSGFSLKIVGIYL